MKNVNMAIANALFSLVKHEYPNEAGNISEVKFFRHNVEYLFFSYLNYRRIFSNDTADYAQMIELGLMPQYLMDFYNSHQKDIDDTFEYITKNFSIDTIQLSSLRQFLFNLEIDFSSNNMFLFNCKATRDNAGAYYTPEDLAAQAVSKIFSDISISSKKTWKIVDFSCGSGDFLISVIRYLNEKYHISSSNCAEWLYGIDIDPIAVQICIVNLISILPRKKWSKIISHFKFGNPLVVCNLDISDKEKNMLFATGRLYSRGIGMKSDFFDTAYDIVVGNPPWEKIRFEEKTFFKGISSTISSISQKNLRTAEIEKLREKRPDILQLRDDISKEYSDINASDYSHPRIDIAISGELNTYSLFTELAYNLLSPNGKAGIIVKSTLVTASSHQKLWSTLLQKKAVRGVYMFENKNKIFNIDSRERFTVLIMSKIQTDKFEFSAGNVSSNELKNACSIQLSEKDVYMINPITKMIPNVSRTEDINFLKDVHNRFKLFADVFPDCHFGRLVHLTAHSKFIEKSFNDNNLPIYEGKFIEQYDSRFATFSGLPENQKYAGKASAVKNVAGVDGKKPVPEARFFIEREFWGKYQAQYPEEYSLCWRSLTSASNHRTMISMILRTCPTCQSIQMLQTPNHEDLLLILALFNSIPFDYLVRIKMPGLDLTQSVVKQIPVPSKNEYDQKVVFNGRTEPLLVHILSYVIYMLKNEDSLSELCKEFGDKTYEVGDVGIINAKRMIDLLFKEAYHIDDLRFKAISDTFTKP